MNEFERDYEPSKQLAIDSSHVKGLLTVEAPEIGIERRDTKGR